MGGLPWHAATFSMIESTANDHFVHVMCTRLRGYTPSIPYRRSIGIPADAMEAAGKPENSVEPLLGWIDKFKLVDPLLSVGAESYPLRNYLMMGVSSWS